MNRSEFFAVAKITKAPVLVKQHGAKGYALSLISKDEENNETEYSLEYQGEPRFFKSMNGIETTLKEQGIFSYTVRMSAEKVEKRTRSTTPATPKATTPKAPKVEKKA